MKRKPLRAWEEDVLAAGELYRVGGSVRNALLDATRQPRGATEDVDYLVCGLSPEELESILKKHGRFLRVGRSFAVYKFRERGVEAEHDIALPREEISTGPGHRDFDVRCDKDLPIERDLRRRDFTINAIAEHVGNGTLVDPFDGRGDIRRGILRMIFPQAFSEDPLRVLRGVRFACRFGLEVEAATRTAMEDNAPRLDTISAERIQDEFDKLLAQCERPSVGFALLHGLGALAVVLPELDRTWGVEQNEYHCDDVFWHSVKTCDHAPRDNRLVRWAALLHDLGKVDKKQVIAEDGCERVVFYGHEQLSETMAVGILSRLRFSSDFVHRCARLVANHMFFYEPQWNGGTVRRFMRRVGEENIADLFALRVADLSSRGPHHARGELKELEELRVRVQQEQQESHALKIVDMAIGGRDVMKALGLGAGPRVGEILEALFEAVLDDPSINTREELLRKLKREYQGESR